MQRTTKVEWDRFLQNLRTFPAGVHKLGPPCSLERIGEVESELGTLPNELAEMLHRFNGAELFVRTGPFITLFGLYQPAEPPAFDGYDWYIDRWTPAWRRKMKRPGDWVIAMKNYGGIVVLGEDLVIGEWDSSQGKWLPDRHPYAEWVARILADGRAYLCGA